MLNVVVHPSAPIDFHVAVVTTTTVSEGVDPIFSDTPIIPWVLDIAGHLPTNMTGERITQPRFTRSYS